MSRYRWAERVLGGLVLVAVAGLVGCKQTVYLDPADLDAVVTAGLPKGMEQNPHDAIRPPLLDPNTPRPTTVSDPVRPPRYITLQECIARALEAGNVGGQSPNQFGFKSEQLVSFGGQTSNATDAIRAFALDPANTATTIERSLSKFDARWITSMTWQKVDQPVAAQFLSFQQQRDAASLTTTLAKPLPTGGTAGITFSVDYSKFASGANQAGFVNPNYTPRVQFSFEQPLLQLFGVEVNQLAFNHPGTSLIQGLRPSGGQGVEGILVTRVRFDQARSQFESQVNYLLINVETAYWNLYSAYYNLYAQEEGLRQSYEGYRFTKVRVDAGTDQPQTLDQAGAQLELFRTNVVTARGQVLESERQLRGLLGLPTADGTRLVPVDEPNLARYVPDFYEGAAEAVALRPELLIARQEVKVQQLNLVLQKNLRMPDLRGFGQYDVAGLGTRLDGSELVGDNLTVPGNAWSSLGNNVFNSWTIGLRLDIPLGFRDANAQVKSAQYTLTRSYLQLRDMELRVAEQYVLRYRRVDEFYTTLGYARSRRQYLEEYTYKIRERVRIGTFDRGEYFNLLQAQRDLADAISREFTLVGQYNAALAELEWSKGTIARYNNVHLAEAALPAHVRKRAADHERERTEAAIKLRERPAHDPAPVSPPHPLGPAAADPLNDPLLQPMKVRPLADMPPSPDLEKMDPKAADPKAAPLPEPMKLPTGGSDAPPKGKGPEVRTVPGDPFGGYGAGGDGYFSPTGQTVPTPRLPPIQVPVGADAPPRPTLPASLPPVR